MIEGLLVPFWLDNDWGIWVIHQRRSGREEGIVEKDGLEEEEDKGSKNREVVRLLCFLPTSSRHGEVMINTGEGQGQNNHLD